MQSSLTPAQKGLLRVLLALGGFMAANSIYLHLSPPQGQDLQVFYQWMLLGHVYVGLLLLLPMAAFILWHFTVVLRKRHPFAVWTGVGIAAAALLLAVTGMFLREKANTEANRIPHAVHWILGLAVPAAYVLHRVSAEQRPTWKRIAAGVGTVAALLGAMGAASALTRTENAARSPEPFRRLGVLPAPGSDPERPDPFLPFDPKALVAEADPASLFYPSPARTVDDRYMDKSALTNGDIPDRDVVAEEVARRGFVADVAIGSETCARCHPDIVEQWKTSAHRFSSFNNPFYKATVLDMRKEPNGFAKSKWCAGCHDPAVLFPGKMDVEFDENLPDAQAGLTCLSCHSIESVHSVGGNGGYTLANQTITPYLFSGQKEGPGRAMHDLLVRSKPDVHKRLMMKPVFSTSEYCAACHKVSLQVPVNDYRWFRGQNDYDSWHNSGVSRNNPLTFYLPPKARTCQDCHMPPEPAPLGDVAAKDGKVRSHRFLGVNTALPAVRGDAETVKRIEEFLADGKLRVDLFALVRGDGARATVLDRAPAPVREGEKVEIQAVVRNLGVGHIFPAGTLDSNEGWLAVEVRDPAGKVLLRSGTLEDDRSLSGDAHVYGAVIIDRYGRRIDRRNAKDIYVPAQVTVIGPGTADLARFSLVVPAGFAGKELSVRAALKWRKFHRDYTEFSFPEGAVPDLPVTTLATAEVRLPVLAAGAALPPPAGPEARGDVDWTRWNDYGIALLLDGETDLAYEAFAEVDRLQPARADGPRNMARAKVFAGKYPEALPLLVEAEKREPGDARTAFWFGRCHLRIGENYDLAEAAYLRVLEEFPDDRNTLADLAQVYYQTRRPEKSLERWLQVLAIDPEDSGAHYRRHLLYVQMGEEEKAAEAKKSFERYKTDENAFERTRTYLNEHPDVNREAQKIHVHELR